MRPTFPERTQTVAKTTSVTRPKMDPEIERALGADADVVREKSRIYHGHEESLAKTLGDIQAKLDALTKARDSENTLVAKAASAKSAESEFKVRWIEMDKAPTEDGEKELRKRADDLRIRNVRPAYDNVAKAVSGIGSLISNQLMKDAAAADSDAKKITGVVTKTTAELRALAMTAANHARNAHTGRCEAAAIVRSHRKRVDYGHCLAIEFAATAADLTAEFSRQVRTPGADLGRAQLDEWLVTYKKQKEEEARMRKEEQERKDREIAEAKKQAAESAIRTRVISRCSSAPRCAVPAAARGGVVRGNHKVERYGPYSRV